MLLDCLCNILEICYSGLSYFELNLLVLAIDFLFQLKKKKKDLISMHILLNFLEDFITLYYLIIPLHLWESAERNRNAPN